MKKPRAAPARMEDRATEWIAATRPFTVRRRVTWGECDPAGVVYVVNYCEYLISVANLFYAHLLGEAVEHARSRHRFETPVKALSMVFDRSLRTGDIFQARVAVTAVRRRSFDLNVEATDERGESVFSAVLSPICIARGERRAIEIPAEFREALQRHLTRAQAPAPPRLNDL